jgi:hypothetical protein
MDGGARAAAGGMRDEGTTHRAQGDLLGGLVVVGRIRHRLGLLARCAGHRAWDVRRGKGNAEQQRAARGVRKFNENWFRVPTLYVLVCIGRSPTWLPTPLSYRHHHPKARCSPPSHRLSFAPRRHQRSDYRVGFCKE